MLLIGVVGGHGKCFLLVWYGAMVKVSYWCGRGPAW